MLSRMPSMIRRKTRAAAFTPVTGSSPSAVGSALRPGRRARVPGPVPRGGGCVRRDRPRRPGCGYGLSALDAEASRVRAARHFTGPGPVAAGRGRPVPRAPRHSGGALVRARRRCAQRRDRPPRVRPRARAGDRGACRGSSMLSTPCLRERTGRGGRYARRADDTLVRALRSRRRQGPPFGVAHGDHRGDEREASAVRRLTSCVQRPARGAAGTTDQGASDHILR